jgi:quinoprotein glucose dehydrogenase
MSRIVIASLLLTAMALAACGVPDQAQNPYPTGTWYAYGGDAGGTRYAPLDQISRENVGRLDVAWTYRTGELAQGSPVANKLTFEATPIFFDGTLYVSTAFGQVIALDAATGKERWTHDPQVDRSLNYSELASRGVSLWIDATAEAEDMCRVRIFLGTIDARLIALDAATGKPCADFGEAGQVDLAPGFNAADNPQYVDYQVTSPPAVVGDVVVTGSSIGDNWQADTGSGAVRAFDARSGEVRWTWQPLLQDSEQVGAANAWSVLSADPERDLVFVPTGSSSPDFYGGLRPGDNRYANSVVALRATTGEVVWAFQTVYHDLWDYDIAAQPALVTVTHDGRSVPAVAQATKTGNLFLLHRETGEPLFPVEERPGAPCSADGRARRGNVPHTAVPDSASFSHAARPSDAGRCVGPYRDRRG